MIELERIDFKNGKSGKTPLNKTNLKKLQDNVENAINKESEQQNTLREDGDLVRKIKISGASEQEGTPSIDSESSIESVGDNINLLKVTATTKTENGITFTVNEDGTILANGTATADATLLVQEITSYPANDYILSDEANGSSSTYFTRLYSGSGGYNTIAQTTNGSMKYSLSEDTDIRTYIIVKSGVTLNNVIFKPKISKKAGAYSPYGQGSIEITMGNGTTSETKALYTQQPFRAIGDAKDRFVKQNGVWYEEHNIGEIVLDGTQGNMYAQPEIGRYDYKIPNAKMQGLCLSTHFVYKYAVEDGKIFLGGTQANRVCIVCASITTLQDMNAWLSENNVVVVYELATPTLIECTPEQVEVLNDIYSAYGEGMTNIICNDEIEPVIEIVKETKETVQSENDKAISMLLARIEELEKKIQ